MNNLFSEFRDLLENYVVIDMNNFNELLPETGVNNEKIMCRIRTKLPELLDEMEKTQGAYKVLNNLYEHLRVERRRYKQALELCKSQRNDYIKDAFSDHPTFKKDIVECDEQIKLILEGEA